jgi:hypothetical protein
MMMMDVIVYPAGMSPIRVVVLGDAFVTDSQIPGRVSLVRYTVVVDAVVGKRLDFRQVTVKKETKKKQKDASVVGCVSRKS